MSNRVSAVDEEGAAALTGWGLCLQKAAPCPASRGDDIAQHVVNTAAVATIEYNTRRPQMLCTFVAFACCLAATTLFV